MRVAIDTTSLESGHKHRGTGRYTESLISSLRQFDSKNTYSNFTRTQKIPDTIELIHYPYFEPFFLSLPAHHKIPVVVTVHDLIPIEYKSHFSIGLRGNIKWNFQRAKLTSVTRIIADSLASKKSIEMYVNYPSERIDVIPLAPSEMFLQQKHTSSKTSLKSNFGIKDEYFLYVGDVNWNKNVLGMIKAFRQVVTHSKSRYDLVLVGKAFQNKDLVEVQELNEYIVANNLVDTVHLVGGVSDENLIQLYTHATACLLVSYAEGFGLPILEAMASGCPVVTSNTSSLAEIAGPSIQVDPWNISDIAAGIVSMIHSDRRKMIMEGKSWVKNYSWERVAKLTVQSYEKAYHHNSSI